MINEIFSTLKGDSFDPKKVVESIITAKGKTLVSKCSFLHYRFVLLFLAALLVNGCGSGETDEKAAVANTHSATPDIVSTRFGELPRELPDSIREIFVGGTLEGIENDLNSLIRLDETHGKGGDLEGVWMVTKLHRHFQKHPNPPISTWRVHFQDGLFWKNTSDVSTEASTEIPYSTGEYKTQDGELWFSYVFKGHSPKEVKLLYTVRGDSLFLMHPLDPYNYWLKSGIKGQDWLFSNLGSSTFRGIFLDTVLVRVK